MRRDIINEIVTTKSRRMSRLAEHGIADLATVWENSTKDQATADLYPIRAVTILEVFTRTWVTELIDQGEPFTSRASELARETKIDFGIASAIHGRVITLGDLVGHAIRTNRIEQIISNLVTLCGAEFPKKVALAVDPWEQRLAKPGEQVLPIITDFNRCLEQMRRLFEVRHILAHELPLDRVYDREEISGWLGAAASFVRASSVVLEELVEGPPALSNYEMGEREMAHVRTHEEALQRIFAELESIGRLDEQGRALVGKSQAAWVAYRDAQCELRADNARGGTLAGILWAREMRELTADRVRQMRWYLERKEYDV